MKRFFLILLALMLLASMPLTALAAEDSAIEAAFTATGDYMATLGQPVAGSTGGEWMVLGFVQSGRPVADSYYDSAVAYINEKIDENQRLHPSKCSPNCRFIISLTAIGKDPTNVDGHNLLSGLSDIGYIRKVGVSGVLWTLLALDCGNYDCPGLDRAELVDALLDYRTSNGGWANSGDIPDPDVTAMVMQALAPYRDSRRDVADAIETGLELLSAMQDSTGNFPGQYGPSSESISQIIVALATLGIDPNTDPRFVKDGASALDGLLGYYVEGGGFRHIDSGKLDGVATEQGYYALTAYYRMLEGKSPLYQLTDAAPLPLPPQNEEAGHRCLWLWIVLGCGAVMLSVCFALKKKLGKRKFSNALMVAVILLIGALGIGFVTQSGLVLPQSKLGSSYRITPIPDNRLVIGQNPENLCTVTVRCDTVLNHLSLLDDAKVPYVPADGIILPEITVEFTPGETVFSVLQRACEAADIPMEYNWAPLYDSYYLEGINHLYEFDCGAESGWMYRVNGAFPSLGCGSYEVQPGDQIEWCYSCIGLGGDLSAENREN